MAKKKEASKSVVERNFRVLVVGLVCVIVGSLLIVWLIPPKKGAGPFGSSVVQKPRNAFNETSLDVEQNSTNTSLTGNANESMVKKVIVGKASSVAATGTSVKGSAIRIEDFVFGPPDGAVDTESGKVTHYLNASLVNAGSESKDCSVEVNTLNGEDTISSISHIGVVKPSEKRGFSLLLLPISGRAQLTVKPVCT